MAIILIANPTADSGAAAETIAKARQLLIDRGLRHSFVPTEPAGGTVKRVRKAVDEEGARLLIYLGGDGTFAEVARGILAAEKGREATLGMLPSGTANDQGKSFGLEAGVDALADNVAVIARGKTRSVDEARLERLDERGRPVRRVDFFDSASIGFSAAVLRQRNTDRERVAEIPILGELYRGHAIYTGAALRCFAESYFEPTKLDVELETGGEAHRFDGLLDLVISNTRVWASSFVLHRQANAEDGKLEVAPIAGRRDLTSKLLSTLRRGLFDEQDLEQLGLRHSEVLQVGEALIRVRPRGEAPALQADGEELDWESTSGELSYRLRVLPEKLRIVADKGELT